MIGKVVALSLAVATTPSPTGVVTSKDWLLEEITEEVSDELSKSLEELHDEATLKLNELAQFGITNYSTEMIIEILKEENIEQINEEIEVRYDKRSKELEIQEMKKEIDELEFDEEEYDDPTAITDKEVVVEGQQQRSRSTRSVKTPEEKKYDELIEWKNSKEWKIYRASTDTEEEFFGTVHKSSMVYRRPIEVSHYIASTTYERSYIHPYGCESGYTTTKDRYYKYIRTDYSYNNSYAGSYEKDGYYYSYSRQGSYISHRVYEIANKCYKSSSSYIPQAYTQSWNKHYRHLVKDEKSTKTNTYQMPVVTWEYDIREKTIYGEQTKDFVRVYIDGLGGTGGYFRETFEDNGKENDILNIAIESDGKHLNSIQQREAYTINFNGNFFNKPDNKRFSLDRVKLSKSSELINEILLKINEITNKPIKLYGYSMGGLIALNAASHDGDESDEKQLVMEVVTVASPIEYNSMLTSEIYKKAAEEIGFKPKNIDLPNSIWEDFISPKSYYEIAQRWNMKRKNNPHVTGFANVALWDTWAKLTMTAAAILTTGLAGGLITLTLAFYAQTDSVVPIQSQYGNSLGFKNKEWASGFGGKRKVPHERIKYQVFGGEH